MQQQASHLDGVAGAAVPALPGPQAAAPAAAAPVPAAPQLADATLTAQPLPAGPRPLSRRTKAAIVVRLLQAEGVPVSLSDLPDALQEALTRDMARLRYVDRATLQAVVHEFADELERVGLAFPGDLDRALAALEGQISDHAAAALRRQAGLGRGRDPWARIAELDGDRLVRVLEEESVEVGAVVLSKLKVAQAAELLGKLPGERARRISYAVSRTAGVRPEAVRRIGQAIVERLEAEPPSVFKGEPVDRLGAILNYSPAATRNQVLEGLEAEDKAFAEGVKKAIFTFANIPARIDPRDVPKITRGTDPAELVRALTAAQALADEKEAAEFILSNMSQRMAQQLRDEMETVGKIRADEGEAAMGAVVAVIRELEETGEIILTAEEG